MSTIPIPGNNIDDWLSVVLQVAKAAIARLPRRADRGRQDPDDEALPREDGEGEVTIVIKWSVAGRR